MSRYNPNQKTIKILDRALELVNSVPYKVSSRWVFYKLLQEGYYGKKSDYKNKWGKISSKARHEFYRGWYPDTLTDETRAAFERGYGDRSVKAWLQSIMDYGVGCSIDKWFDRDCYVELWYEARAMTDQFKYYTEHITLRPMGGQPSIPYKWETAKSLEKKHKRYQLPIIVLYFGDLDVGGGIISEVVERDVRKWCHVDFEFIHCGLNYEQVIKHNVPENPEKPATFQWEALSDEAAQAIIEGGTSQYLDPGCFAGYAETEEEAELFLIEKFEDLIEKWEENHD